MTNYHAWKRRLWGPDYPIENGPPYLDPGTGAPILPGGAQGGPFNGMDDNGPNTGNPVVLTFTGTLTADTQVIVLILDETAGAPPGGRWVGANVVVASGSTATQVGDAVAADFEARNWPGWVSAVNVAGTVTFTPQAAGTATGYVLYQTPAGARIATPPPEPPTGDFVKGPFETKGKKYWLQREGDDWYVWFDVVEPFDDPDTRSILALYLADKVHEMYAAAILRKARNFGYRG